MDGGTASSAAEGGIGAGGSGRKGKQVDGQGGGKVGGVVEGKEGGRLGRQRSGMSILGGGGGREGAGVSGDTAPKGEGSSLNAPVKEAGATGGGGGVVQGQELHR